MRLRFSARPPGRGIIVRVGWLLATAQAGPEAVLGRPSFLWFGTSARVSRGKGRIFAGLNSGGSCPEAWCVQFAVKANELPGVTRGVLEDFRKRLLSRVPAKTGSLGRSKCKKLNQIKTIVLKIEPERLRFASHVPPRKAAPYQELPSTLIMSLRLGTQHPV